MEPSNEAISVRLARLCSEFSGSQVKLAGSAARWRRSLHREGLMDALTALYDECNNDALKRQYEHIAKFVDKYRCVLTELRRVRVNINDFEVKDLIGRGHFGEVHVVREKLTGDIYAMKTLRKDDTLTQKEVAFYEEERDIMALATSPWITRLQYAFQDSYHLYLVMEFCSGGDLAALLERRAEPLKQRDAAFYVAQLNQALNALHTMGFLHRDIKPDNVLVDRCGHLKLADFGSAVRIGQSGRATSCVPVGTPDYIAPELLAAAEHSKPTSHGTAVDYWSLGVVAYELVSLRTPFSDNRKPSAAHTFGNIQQYREHKFHLQWPAADEKPSQEYRDMVGCLLTVDPTKRYNYLETLRHPALKDMSWNTIRDQVPPFVPLVRSNDDTSHFSECSVFAERSTAPALRNFRSKTAFCGNDLPFIGFTYAPEPCAPLGHVCCNHGGGDSTGSASSGGFNNTLNNTAIDLASYREIEKLAERRAAEIESLQSRAALAESEGVLQRERERRLAALEQQRAKLEHEVTELIVQNQRLSRQLEMEHEERGDLERKSLELIEAAKRKWTEKSRVKTEELRAQIASQEKRIRDQSNENDGLKERIEELTKELKSSLVENEAMRKLQLNYKEVLYMVHELKHRRHTELNVRPIDSMAKARAVSRASIAGLASAESSRGAIEAGRELARERAERRGAEARAELAAEKAKSAEDAQTTLRVELLESRKDYADLKERYASLESDRTKLCNEASNAERRSSQLERRNSDLEQRAARLEERLAAEQREADLMRAKIDELKSKVTESSTTESALEEQHARTTARLQEKLEAAQQQRIELQSQLDAATLSTHRHRDKITELECLVMKLDGEVSKLALQRGARAGEGEHAAQAQVQLLKEQLAGAEQQLQATRDELHSLKQEARKTTSALWKKEKELSDSELDRRIAVRELKAAEEKAARATEARRAATESWLAEKRRLEAACAAAEQEAKDAKAEVERMAKKLAEAERSLVEQLEKIQSRSKTEDKLNSEIDRYKNDIRKLKCELQYSESRRLKAEASVERDREELRRAQEEHASLREDAAGLRAALDERTRLNQTLEANNKMLQEACRMLEEQLVDFERISDLQENKTKNIESDVSRVRTELEQCRAQLLAAESLAADHEQRAGSAARQHGEAETLAHRLQRQLHDLQERMREKEERCMELEVQLAASAAERESLQRKVSSAAQRLQQVQEESSALLTATHQLTTDNMRLQHRLREAQEEAAAAREASGAAAAWWRTRETKADATLRQQAKLIDFLQSKVEELGRKKKTLGGMLFGSRSHGGKSPAPPGGAAGDVTRALVRERQANRELREELTRLKSLLPAESSHSLNANCEMPKTEKRKSLSNGHNTSSGSTRDSCVRIVREGSSGSERVSARAESGHMVWRSGAGAGELRARLLTAAPAHTRLLSQTDAQNAFTVRTVTCEGEESETMTVVCDSSSERTRWLGCLAAPGAGAVVGPGLGYAPRALLSTDAFRPTCLLEPRPGLYAIGTEDGLYSYQAGHSSPVRVATPGVSSVEALCVVPQAAQVLLLAGGALRSAELRGFLSTLERAACVAPAIQTEAVSVGNGKAITHLEVMPRRHSAERTLVSVSIARRVIFLTCDAAAGWRTLRTIELPAPAVALLFTAHTLLVAADRIYELDLQRYTVEDFLDLSDATLSATLRTASRPQAILPIRDCSADEDTEYLICYRQVGIFVDEFGRRTRSDDVKWTSTPTTWSFRKPYLFVVQEDRVEISKIDECAYRLPACQCDAVSMASTVSDCAIPDKCSVNLQCPHLLGNSSTAGAILLREGAGRSCSIVEVDGTRALKKIGVSVETLNSSTSADVLSTGAPSRDIDEPDNRAESDTESTHTEDSSSECRTDFLSDIRKRAKQIRTKIQDDKRKDDAIRQILASEITGTFVPRMRRHSEESEGSEFSAESSSADGREAGPRSEDGRATDSAAECHVVGRTTADICNDIFLRKQVRFDNN